MKSIFLLLGCCLLNACNYYAEKEVTRAGERGALSYESIKTQILEPRCLECHEGSETESGIDLSTYESIMESGVVEMKQPENSLLFTSVESDSMPKDRPALSDADKYMIYEWIKKGALESGDSQ